MQQMAETTDTDDAEQPMGRRGRRAEKAGEADATKQAEEEALAQVERRRGLICVVEVATLEQQPWMTFGNSA